MSIETSGQKRREPVSGYGRSNESHARGRMLEGVTLRNLDPSCERYL
jgi:hypothetical protein